MRRSRRATIRVSLATAVCNRRMQPLMQPRLQGLLSRATAAAAKNSRMSRGLRPWYLRSRGGRRCVCAAVGRMRVRARDVSQSGAPAPPAVGPHGRGSGAHAHPVTTHTLGAGGAWATRCRRRASRLASFWCRIPPRRLPARTPGGEDTDRVARGPYRSKCPEAKCPPRQPCRRRRKWARLQSVSCATRLAMMHACCPRVPREQMLSLGTCRMHERTLGCRSTIDEAAWCVRAEGSAGVLRRAAWRHRSPGSSFNLPPLLSALLAPGLRAGTHCHARACRRARQARATWQGAQDAGSPAAAAQYLGPMAG